MKESRKGEKMEESLRVLSDKIVNYSLKLKEGEKVLITTMIEAKPLVLSLLEEMKKIGVVPMVKFTDPEVAASLTNMTDDKRTGLLPHNCILEDRKKLSVSGVNDVGSFDEQTIVAVTDCGELTIRGEKLHITKLSLEVGELCIEGKISALQYTDVTVKSGSFLSRVFR